MANNNRGPGLPKKAQQPNYKQICEDEVHGMERVAYEAGATLVLAAAGAGVGFMVGGGVGAIIGAGVAGDLEYNSTHNLIEKHNAEVKSCNANKAKALKQEP